MNEKRIEQVLEIEKQAQQILDGAKRDADQLPARAEQEAREMVERARTQAQEEARQMLEKAQSQEETAGIVSKAEEKNRDIEKRATQNLDKAVAYVLDCVIGKA